MKKQLRWRSGLIVIAMMLAPALTYAQTILQKTYTEDPSNFVNPERGFYRHTETPSGSYSHLNATNLKAFRDQGISLILRLFYLTDFADKAIPQQYLSSMQQDFDAIRASGVKAIVRFAYTKRTTAPYGDATPDWALKHIAQLKPVLQANRDVIALVQAGFIGAWGEWYYTDHFSATLGNPTAADWVNRRALVNALLDATPTGRVVQLRTPAIKFSITESTVPLSDAEAFTDTQRARLGHHNDCFLASSNDVGTYTSNMTAEKAFLEQETQYLPIGGETCGVSVPYSECPNALEQMERFHWSYLNRDYHGSVIGSWEDDNCLQDVYRNLGYRFRLTKAKLQQDAKPGSSVSFLFELVNDGWANPYNERNVEVVVRHSVTGKTLTLPVDTDPRRWPLNDTIKISAEGGLPSNVAEGSYEVLLNLPDPEITLRENPDYSIRLANNETWEVATGFNKLNHSLTVSVTSAAPVYTGNKFFSAREEAREAADLATDGLSADWSAVETFAQTSEPLLLKVENTEEKLSFLLESPNAIGIFQIFIDADPSVSSGQLVAPWNSHRADYRITASGLSTFQGGVWSSPVAVEVAQDGGVAEVSVPISLLTTVPPGPTIFLAADAGASNRYVPAADLTFAPYRLKLGMPTPLKMTSSGDQVILYWAEQIPGVRRVIQRSTDGLTFQTIAIGATDDFTFTETSGLPEVYYRSYVVNESTSQVSPITTSSMVTLKERPLFYEFLADGDVAEWEGVTPLATGWWSGQTNAYRVFTTASELHVMVEVGEVESYAFYFDTDNSTATGSADNDWNFSGFDFMLSEDKLFDMRGDNPIELGTVMKATSGQNLELSIPLSLLDNLNDNTTIVTAARVNIDGGASYFPAIASEPLIFVRALPSPTPAAVTVSNSETLPESQLIIQWQACSGCSGYVVERATASPDEFEIVSVKGTFTFAYYDNDLVSGTKYYYRVSSYNEAGLSLPSEVLFAIPGAVTAVEPHVSNVSVFPNPVEDRLTVESPDRNFQIFSARGELISVPSRSDGNRTQMDFSRLPPGLYLLRSISSKEVTRIVKR